MAGCLAWRAAIWRKLTRAKQTLRVAGSKYPRRKGLAAEAASDARQLHFAVALEAGPFGAEIAVELLHQINRPVLSAGATNGHGYIAAVVAGQFRQPLAQEIADVPVHQRDLGLLLQIFRHGLVAAGQGPQMWLVVGVGQHAHIKHVIGIGGHAALECK